ncbi:MAG: uroporphyrinogen decarboxylase, partial [Caldilineae bacterium]
RLDVHNGALARELEAIQHLAAGLNGEAPFLMTLFSPLTVAYKLCGSPVSGQHLMEHMRQAPEKLHAGLAAIRDAVIEYADACLEAGAPGFFYATQMATGDLLTREEFLTFGRAYDLAVLEALQGRSQITMLHVCRKNLLFDLVADYPVDVINWAAGDSNVSLADARAMTDTALAGGLSLDTLLHGSPEDVEAEVRGAVAQAGREGFILAPDCVIKGPSPDANLAAARQAVEQLT